MRHCSCGRQLDRYQHVCSECRQSNIDIAQDIYNASKEHKKRALEYYHRVARPRRLRSYWKNLATEKAV